MEAEMTPLKLKMQQWSSHTVFKNSRPQMQ
jgi:hypothetical protein